MREDTVMINRKKASAINEEYARVLGKAWLPEGQSDKKTIEIKEIPVMVTNDGTIVCIPKLPEMGLIAAIGLTGTGKTLTSGRILDEIFWSWGDNVAIMNDSQEETYCWSEPCNNLDFIFTLKKINQKPIPLPMLYIFPNFAGFSTDENIVSQKNSVRITIPFEEVIQNIEKYISGLGASEKYLLAKKEELLNITNESELNDVIDSIDTGTKGMDTVVNKLKSSFGMLINEGLINLSDVSIPAYLSVKDRKSQQEIYTGNPFTTIMKAGCIPSFITSHLYTQKYKDAIFSYYINCMFDESLKGTMKGSRVWLYFDELTKVVHSNPEYNSPETERALTNIASRGRNNGISLVYATQRYNEIPKPIRSQTKYALVFRHKSKEETKLICDDFALGRSMQNRILTLRKHECIATTTEYFVCYKGTKRWEETDPISGIILPPLHKNRFLQKKEEK